MKFSFPQETKYLRYSDLKLPYALLYFTLIWFKNTYPFRKKQIRVKIAPTTTVPQQLQITTLKQLKLYIKVTKTFFIFTNCP